MLALDIHRQLFAWSIVLLQTRVIAKPFGTTSIGQHAVHEMVTRAALGCHSTKYSEECFESEPLDLLAGTWGSSGAVGIPDLSLDVFKSEPHCDGADYLDNGRYFQDRTAATKALQECVEYMRQHFQQGIESAKTLLAKDGTIAQDQVLGSCTYPPRLSSKTRCAVLGEFGLVLHAVQDFYAHSNWADVTTGTPSILNPPGLNLAAPSYLLNLLDKTPINPPKDLSTGCFAGPNHDTQFGEQGTFPWSDCRQRITHFTINKDIGVVDPVSGDTSKPESPRGKQNDNFRRAVHAAMEESKRQWLDFRRQLKASYGDKKAGRMICALTRKRADLSCL